MDLRKLIISYLKNSMFYDKNINLETIEDDELLELYADCNYERGYYDCQIAYGDGD